MLTVYPELLVPSLDTPGSAVLPDPGGEAVNLDILTRPPRHNAARAKTNSHAVSDHFHLKRFSFGDSEKKSSGGVPPDPFSILGPKVERTVVPTVIRSPLQTDDREARMSMLSDHDHDKELEWDTSCAQEDHHEAISNSVCSSEQEIPLRFIGNHQQAVEEKADSDYSSDHSKDIAQAQMNMNTAVWQRLTLGTIAEDPFPLKGQDELVKYTVLNDLIDLQYSSVDRLTSDQEELCWQEAS